MLELEEFVGKNFTLKVTKKMEIDSNHEFLTVKKGEILYFCHLHPLHQKKEFTHFKDFGNLFLYINVENKEDIEKLSSHCKLINTI